MEFCIVGRTTSDPKTSKSIPKDSKLDLSRTVEKLKAENARKDLKIAEYVKLDESILYKSDF